MPGYIVHPRMMQTLSPGFFPSVGFVQVATEVRDAAGQPISTWTDLAGHNGIDCRVEAVSGSKTKATNQIFTTATHTISLKAYYPAITAKMRFVVNGVNYDILFVDHAGLHHLTRLICQVKQ